MTTLHILFDSDRQRAGREHMQAILDADDRYNRGEHVEAEHRLRFESPGLLSTVLSDKRCALIQHLIRKPEPSIRALSLAVNRDYKRVHEDVAVLLQYGLVEKTEKGLKAPYNEFAYRVRFDGPAMVVEEPAVQHA